MSREESSSVDAATPKKKRETYINASRHSYGNRHEIEKSDLCGCHHCLFIFPPCAIVDWDGVVFARDGIFETEPATARCPRCYVEAVIGSASGFPITRKYLAKVRSAKRRRHDREFKKLMANDKDGD